MTQTDSSAAVASNNSSGGLVTPVVRILAGFIVTMALLFLFNNYLTFWRDWPGVMALFAHLNESARTPLADEGLKLGWTQLIIYIVGLLAMAGFVLKTPQRSLRTDAQLWSDFAAYIVRAAFWTVVMVGLVDSLISFMRIEGFLEAMVGSELSKELGRPQFRGTYVHYPLMLVAFVLAGFIRTLGFTWLALLVVLAEFQIVLSRFVFSYEQAFMGDLVRFWYAALFLFASAYTLIHDGHVRVDVLYARFDHRVKAWANIGGLTLLGLPLCWVILTTGMWSKGSSINSPLLSFEITQSGYGLYVKYLMVGFLVVFALSMIVQFASYLLSNVADLREEDEEGDEHGMRVQSNQSDDGLTIASN
ncbi:TRAP transporter small permease subunit [Aestuariirhabdus sp. Z084]|uniref:TRAP transporter small permease subunit n=1 Tax=Aestuariirhabdus haliotis TaxID=2918751 RepID=UPI00201B3911|nr:TRAP transporter small permease subunit [Aestuariirhabdus haliotis]MCL6417291.1 TRAP transporter small permease subunit [Aestuariirhabdus haliotis]MCL6421236.1 TRAP transporter small permease subunit [Aestuariirhabdus haliotis]